MPINNSSINLAKQSEFIRKHGEWLYFFRSMKCTCSLIPQGSMIADANRANPNCKACHGLGLIWQDQGQIIGLVQTVNQQKDLLQAGIAAPGDLVLSPDPRYTISDYDKIQMNWGEGIPYEPQLLRRSATGGTDTANYTIMEVIECIQIDPTTGNITTYVPEVDFTFDKKLITWIGNKPANGSVYSIKYSALIDWICFAPPQPRRERETNLGQKIIMRKKHLVAFGQ
jgi:hypothetical protein